MEDSSLKGPRGRKIINQWERYKIAKGVHPFFDKDGNLRKLSGMVPSVPSPEGTGECVARRKKKPRGRVGV